MSITKLKKVNTSKTTYESVQEKMREQDMLYGKCFDGLTTDNKSDSDFDEDLFCGSGTYYYTFED